MAKLLILTLLAFMAASNIQAQIEIIEEQPVLENDRIGRPVPDEPNAVDPDEVNKVVEVMPEFPGGKLGILNYLISIKYPAEAQKKRLQGDVKIQIVINEDGTVSNVTLDKSSGHEILDNAALEHIKLMPAWKPATQGGKPVKVQYVLPIKFRL